MEDGGWGERFLAMEDEEDRQHSWALATYVFSGLVHGTAQGIYACILLVICGSPV